MLIFLSDADNILTEPSISRPILCVNHRQKCDIRTTEIYRKRVSTSVHIGANIAELRKAIGVKQEDVAKIVGVSAQAVSKWENGGTPDTELLPRIADYFSVSIDKLFGRITTDYSDIEAEVTKYIAKSMDGYRGHFRGR